MPLTLRWASKDRLPAESDDLRPDRLQGCSPEEAAARPARLGRAPLTLGALFRIEGDRSDGPLTLEGDLGHVRFLGAGMQSGRLIVRGNAGPHLGAQMRGGAIEVTGSAGPWLGAEMRDGSIHVAGSAEDYVGSAYPGSKRGMKGGVIWVEGDVGRDSGLALRRGVIVIGGAAGDGLGRSMIAGTIFALGAVGRDVGLGMKRGSIILLEPPSGFEPPIGFWPTGRHCYPFLGVFARELNHQGVPLPLDLQARPMSRWNGDRLEGGRGEILLALD